MVITYHLLESWQKTIDLVFNAKQLMIPEMKHSHSAGTMPDEIERFIEDTFSGNDLIPSIGRPQKIGKWFESTIEKAEGIDKVVFVFTRDTQDNKERKWEQIPAKWYDNKLLAEGSHDIKAAYFLVTYAHGSNRISSPVRFY